jgi:hypothetical protein
MPGVAAQNSTDMPALRSTEGAAHMHGSAVHAWPNSTVHMLCLPVDINLQLYYKQHMHRVGACHVQQTTIHCSWPS